MKRQYRIGIAGFEHMHIVEHVEYFLLEKRALFMDWRRGDGFWEK